MIRNKSAIEFKLDVINIINNNIIIREKSREHILMFKGITLDTMIIKGELRTLNSIKDHLLDLPTIKGGE